LCVAQFLPKGVTVADVTIEKGSANATVVAKDIVLDQKTFENLGSCS
jgi:phosphoribosylcarboxyaminoimidazole (NCAIR) mutase